MLTLEMHFMKNKFVFQNKKINGKSGIIFHF